MRERLIPGAACLRAVLVCLLLLAAVPVLAQSGAGYDLTWSTVDGGGGTFSVGGGYSLGGTAGQPDADLLTDGAYTLAAGFWGSGAPAGGVCRVYLPLVLRNH